MKVLIAEDDKISSWILQRAVERFGHECNSAENGKDAWLAYNSSEIDVIISDWVMPEMDGLELCRLVRGSPKTNYTYFVFLTALEDKEHLLIGMEAGADNYMTKPLDLMDLRVQFINAQRLSDLHRKLVRQNKELEWLNTALYEQARRDPLTKLGNNLRMFEDLETLKARVDRYRHSYCAALFDIDSFKSYNDHYGHLFGNEALKSVADVLAKHCRLGDSSYRFGGEEFLILFPEQTTESAIVAVERMRKAVEALGIPHESKAPPGIVTVSAGIAALAPDEEKSVKEWLREADEALFLAKESGKNRSMIYPYRKSA